MKRLLTIALAITLITTAVKAANPGESITISHSKNKSLFVFKANKSLIGATVQVYTSDGDLVICRPLEKRKMTIDFGQGTKDTYTIRVVKGDATMEYQFSNN